MVTFEYVFATAVAAFAASGAAILLGAILDARARKREAKSRIIRALQRHIERLWEYSTAHGDSYRAGANNGATNRGQFAPFKPPMDGLRTEIRAERQYFKRRAQECIDEIITDCSHFEVASERKDLADWERESSDLHGLAERVGRWDMRSSRLPND